MPKNHRQWYTIYGYFKDIPVDPKFIKHVKDLVKEGHNVLIMIKKEDHETNPKFNPSQKFQAIATALEDEMTQSKITISTVPDTTTIEEWNGKGITSKEEQLSEYAHDAWLGWIKYMFSKCMINSGNGTLEIPKWAVDRWTRQSNTSYKDLSEDEKESDRKEARKIIKIFKKEI